MVLQLKQGDCLTLIKEVPSNSIDLLIIDPPYKTITGGDINGKNSSRPKGMLSGNRKLFDFQTNITVKDWIGEAYRVLKDGSHAYIFTNALNMKDMLEESERVGFKLHNILVWEKNNCTPSQYYMKNCEYVLFLRKGKAKYINNIGSSKTVHTFKNIIGNKTHPCQKPVDLLSFYIENSSKEGDTVMDMFMGSGSTGAACIKTKRNFIGYEIDENFFNIAKSNIDKAEKENQLYMRLGVKQ